MELEFFGANCFRLKTKQATIVFDDNLASLGKKSIVNDKVTPFFTQAILKEGTDISSNRLVIDSAGEYEVGDVTVKGVQARAHIDEEGAQSATVFQCLYGGQTVTILGHVHPDVSDDVIELINGTDVLVVPVGGNGFTLDPVGASTVIKKVEPSVVVPSYYSIDGFDYPVPAQSLEDFSKVFPISTEPQDSLKITQQVDGGTGSLSVIVLNVK